jgi:hypothetical protein
MNHVVGRTVLAVVVAGCASVAARAAPVPAAPPAPAPPAVLEMRRPIKNQSPEDAVFFVRPLLSPTGSVELRGHDLVIRDRSELIAHLQHLLDDFDHPRIALRMVVQVVQAGPKYEAAVSPVLPPKEVPEPLRSRLLRTLRYPSLRLLAQGGFEANEGTEVRSAIGADFPVSFRFGTLRAGQTLQLRTFRIARADTPDDPLVSADLFMPLDQPLVVGLTNDEGSQSALLVVLTCTRPAPTAVP